MLGAISKYNGGGFGEVPALVPMDGKGIWQESRFMDGTYERSRGKGDLLQTPLFHQGLMYQAIIVAKRRSGGGQS